MTKAQYNKLFDKASEYYHSNDGKITTTTPGYSKFKAACDLLIASNFNDIEISTDPDDKYAHYKELNQMFNAISIDTLLDEEW